MVGHALGEVGESGFSKATVGLTQLLGAPQNACARTLIAAARATEGGSLDAVPLDAGLA